MTPITIQQAFDLAIQHHQAGRLDEAEKLYRQILAQQPQQADAIHNLGLIALQLGRKDAAIDLLRQAVAISPDYVEAHNNLGTALADRGNLDEAIAAYRRAIALSPNLPQAHYNLGIALKDKGEVDQAIAAFRQAIIHRPSFPEAYYNLGNALKDRGQLDEAIAVFRHAIQLNPSFAEAQNNLGNLLKNRGEFDNAIAAYRQAIAIRPNYAEAHNNLGIALRDKGQLDEAFIEYRQAIAIKPHYAEAHNNLGIALRDKGQLDEAIAASRQAIALKPNFAEAYLNLGNALKDTGQLDDAIAAYRQAIAAKPSYTDAASNLIFALYFHPTCDAKTIAEEERCWNRQHAEPLAKLIPVHTNDCSPERRLCIGYVSPDFRNHCQAMFMLPLLVSHDREQVAIHCYSVATNPDAITARHASLAEVWRDCRRMSDQDLANQIRADQIDILVDLSLHMSRNRLLVFVRKPAPIQVTWLGYPGSTGLRTIDYRLSDPYLDPPGRDESIYSEQTIRLPDSFWCYDPLQDREVPVNALPASNAGTITFGCLNNFCKINDAVLSLWSQVLKQIENSRLLILAPEGYHRQRLLNQIHLNGIDPARIEFVSFHPRQAYLELYHRIDIGLDSFPSNGHTTSLDSFWMGVPVVTLVGQSPVSRAGWCQLSNLGLTELAAQTPEQFVRIAVELANDLPRLSDLRRTLRQRMEQSPLMDAPKFARNMEAAYRQMWRNWCQKESESGRQESNPPAPPAIFG